MDTLRVTSNTVTRMPILVLAGLFWLTLIGSAQSSRITGVAPLTAKVGDVVSAKGEGIGPANVDELYLTNAGEDVKVAMVEQSENMIKFRVPAGVKAGRWALMIHMKSGSGTRFFEQPVKLTVE